MQHDISTQLHQITSKPVIIKPHHDFDKLALHCKSPRATPHMPSIFTGLTPINRFSASSIIPLAIWATLDESLTPRLHPQTLVTLPATPVRMPYTPPAQLSPAASKQNSPAPTRSHSYINGPSYSNGPMLSPESGNRPNLPRSSASSTYLSKHRRSPSLNDAKDVLYNGEAAEENSNFDPHGSLRKSPPPSNNALIPTGMTISPPDSSQNSSDEEDNTRRRGRNLEVENLKELQAAISAIEQRRESSPSRGRGPSQPASSEHKTSGPDHLPLSREARKITHSRSSTDSNIVFDGAATVPATSPAKFHSDDEDSDGSPPSRPSMVRKKSGELVRPALRPPSRRRPSSMPGTPTYSKAVHFDSHLEHVRHFLQVDRPLAVSAGSSPVEQNESENEFPFGSDESTSRPRGPPYEWEIKLSNFPYQDVDSRRAHPVHVERIFLSSDNKTLIGSIAVQNLAFQKAVVSRFTFDYWKTTSEVVADYSHDVRRKQQDDGLDRFTFGIKLADQVNLENKTMFFCVRYNVGGQEYWDSNSGYNYQVDFSKKLKPQNGKNGMPLGARPPNALPRSRPSPPTSSGQRPKSYPVSFDDLTAVVDSVNLGDTGSFANEPVLKLRGPKSKVQIVPDAPTRRSNVGSQAFGNRYDFNSSLNAAKNNAYAVLGEQSGLSSSMNAKQTSREVPAANAAIKPNSTVSFITPESGMGRVKAESSSQAPAVGAVLPKPAALLSEKPSLASQSYQELVEKYCFFGTARSTPPLTRSALSLMDGAGDDVLTSDVSESVRSSKNDSGSSTPTPPRGSSPSPPSEISSAKVISPQLSRSSSPMPEGGSCYGSRSASPSFGYSYHSSAHQLISETPTSTAIHG